MIGLGRNLTVCDGQAQGKVLVLGILTPLGQDIPRTLLLPVLVLFRMFTAHQRSDDRVVIDDLLYDLFSLLGVAFEHRVRCRGTFESEAEFPREVDGIV